MHIRNLLLTFFLRYFEDLVLKGHVYILETPLFRVRNKKETRYCYTDAERDVALDEIKGPEVTRFKGLGEMMPKTLKETTLDPKRRQLIQVGISDELATDRTINALMGKDASSRYEFIMEQAGEVEQLDV